MRQRVLFAVGTAQRRHGFALVRFLLPVGQEKEHFPLRALITAAKGVAFVNGGGVQQLLRRALLGGA